MSGLSDPDEARVVLDDYLDRLRQRGWDALWAMYADERVTRLGRRVTFGNSEERREEVVAASGRRYTIESFASATAAPHLHILFTLYEEDDVQRTLGDSLIVVADSPGGPIASPA